MKTDLNEKRVISTGDPCAGDGRTWSRVLRALRDGDTAKRSPNQRHQLHAKSLLLHLRPRSFPAESIRFSHTYHLGFLAVFLLAVEMITGLILMVYYVPTPDGAYASIVRITTRVPFGTLFRDLHRLAGEIMIVVVVLHMLRTFLTGSFTGRRRLTWVTGVAMLLLTLGFVFSGYLLPWDQLAYWAVTIGTSMIETVPVIGYHLNLWVRGAPDIGADGLLRFYILHVVVLPLFGCLLMASHYYRISRLHGGSKPVHTDTGRNPEVSENPCDTAVDFIPDVMIGELFRSCTALILLVAVAIFIYDAPLGSHADPGRTPVNTHAPWFFLWLQGLLKLGDKALMGVAVPVVVSGVLFAVPLLDTTPRKPLRRRPMALGAALFAGVAFIGLTYMGTPRFGISLPPADRILQELVPDEGRGRIDAIPYDALTPGIYATQNTAPQSLPPELASVFAGFKQALERSADNLALPGAHGVMMVEDWQSGLKRITFRIVWTNPDNPLQKSQERIRYRMEMPGC